jgi:site-specific DNA-methyltransferase (adenine-specific)
MGVLMSNLINFHNADCMEFMKQVPDKYYSLALVDPPYGIGAGKMTMGSGKHKFKKGKNWDSEIPKAEYFNELFRISKNQIIWGGNYFALPLNNNWLIWDKLNPNLSFSEAELAWCSIDKNIRIFKRYSAMDDIDGPKRHPTQKPVALYEWLLSKYAKPNDKIIDTHGGSGSIAIAVDKANTLDNTNYSLDIIELDKDYFKDSVNRFNQYKSQSTIQFQ